MTSVLASGEQAYAATDHGVALSSDKGQTFMMRTTTDGLGSISVRRLALSGSTLYAATSTGLSISNDGGATWLLRGDAAGVTTPANDAWFRP